MGIVICLRPPSLYRSYHYYGFCFCIILLSSAGPSLSNRNPGDLPCILYATDTKHKAYGQGLCTHGQSSTGTINLEIGYGLFLNEFFD